MKLLMTHIDETNIHLGNRIVISLYDDNGVNKLAMDIEVNHQWVCHLEFSGLYALRVWNGVVYEH
jgi:hypothetical protein